MHSAVQEREETGAGEAFTRLTGQIATRVVRLQGGRNSRIYALETHADRFALKEYFNDPRDPRKRYETEKRALELFAAAGVRNVPRFIAGDGRTAVLSWMPGEPLQSPAEPEIDAILDFISHLRDLPRTAHGEAASAHFAALTPAFGGLLRPENLFTDVARRAADLRTAAVHDAELAEFMQTDFGPLHDASARNAKAMLYRAAIEPEREIPQPCIISGDFGCHNIIRDGMHLGFVDFEYFGWDDPVKLIGDFLLHPATDIAASAARRFLEGARALFAADESFDVRLRAYYPLIGLRWAAIALNEFILDRAAGREFAGIDAGDARTRRKQIDIARGLVRRAQAGAPQ